MRTLTILATSLAALSAVPADAALFCVGTPAELSAALSSADSNAQNDIIRIRNGVYALPSRVEVVAENGFSLDVSGGWSSVGGGQCNLFNGAADSTVLNAGAVPGTQVMRVLSAGGNSGNVTVSHLGMTGGRGLGANAGCLNVDVGTNSSQIILDRLAIAGCHNNQTLSAGAVSINHDGSADVILRNSVIVENSSTSGAAVTVIASGPEGSTVRLFNNTIANNHPVTTSAVPAGVRAWQISGQIELFNNAIVGNGLANQADVESVTNLSVEDNVLSKNWVGPVTAAGTNHIVANWQPLFTDYPSNLRPAPTSLLRDEGSLNVVNFAGTADFAFTLRVQGNRIDVGAYEFETLLRNGFE